MSPHGRSGIGQSAVGEGIRGKQEAEIIGDKRQRNGAQGEEGKTQEKRSQANGRDHQALSPRQSRKWALDARKPGGAKPGHDKCHCGQDRSKAAFDQPQRSSIVLSSRQEHIGLIMT